MPRRRRRPRIRPDAFGIVAPYALALTYAFALACACAPGQAAAAPKSASRPAKSRPVEVMLPVSASGPGVQVAMPPIGLSIEYPTMAADLGGGPCPPPALVSTLQALGAPPLQLAGDSQDETAPPGALTGQQGSWETATLYSLPASFWSQLHCLLSATREPLTVGLDARTGQQGWAAQMVAGAQGAATNGLAFSLGNEPDLYYLPNYASLSRAVPDEEAAAASTYLGVAATLRQAVGSAPVVGPELARPGAWREQLPRIIASLPVQTVGVHAYPLSACVTPRAVTVGGMLAARSGDAPARLAWVVADARAAGVPAILSEANSASCGGVAGVSDSPASGVWAVRFVLNALLTGFQEVRFHFSSAPYDPFVLSGERVLQRPLYPALTALSQWLPVGATLHPVHDVRGLAAVSILAPASGTPTMPGTAPSTETLILDNEGHRAQAIVLRGAHAFHLQTLTPRRAGVLGADLVSARSRVKLEVPPNGVMAISAEP